MKRFLECCCTSLHEALEAERGGAGRIELCEDLPVGGVTPSEELLASVMQAVSIPVNVLVRPRGGDFVFTESEAQAMLESIRMCKRLKVNAVVIGALTPEGDVDLPLMRRLIAEARPLEVTFHRAFDECSDPLKSFEEIVQLGCDRLLTSGHEADAFNGRGLIARLVGLSQGRMVVMPGCGVRTSNIAAIEAETGALEFHSSSHGPAGTTSSEVVRELVSRD